MNKTISVLIFLFSINIFSAVPLERYAVLVSNNYGGKDRVLLKYTGSDVEKMYNIFNNLTGVSLENIVVVKEGSATNLLAEIDNFKNKIKKNKAVRKELIFYYSGHSDDKGLLLGETALSYSRLKNVLTNLGIDLTVVILDSCYSGSFLRTKGGITKPSFLIDEANSLKGYAFLSSSASDESSQESDKIKGSYFTYYLSSGLKGAADFSNDGKVSLNEVYNYAYNQTIASTELTRQGVQHPSYELNITGNGDLILAETNKAKAKLVFSENIWGRVFLRDENNNLVAEFNKIKGKILELAVDSSFYSINVLQKDELWTTEKAVKNGSTVTVNVSDLNKGTLIASNIKGGGKSKNLNIGANFDEKYFTNIYAKYSYKNVFAVFNTGFAKNKNLYTQGVGIGAKYPVHDIFIINADFLISNTAKDKLFNTNGNLYQFRTYFDIKINDYLFVQIGPTLNYFGDDERSIDNAIIKDGKAKRLGFILGVNFLF